MGNVILDKIVQLLQENEILAEAAQPAGNMVAVENILAAVSLESVDQAKETATIMVEVIGPAKHGAKICQIRALRVCDVLGSAGAVCRQDKCSFVSKADLFCVPVTAVFHGIATSEGWWPHPGYTVSKDGKTLPQVTGFSSRLQMQGEEMTSISEAVWEFTLEEFLPVGSVETADIAEPFTMEVSNGTITEIFSGCRLTHRERTMEIGGIRQICRGTAEQRLLRE